jgi:hypothetical protein
MLKSLKLVHFIPPPLVMSKVKRPQTTLNLPLPKLTLHGYGGGCLKRRALKENKTCFKR